MRGSDARQKREREAKKCRANEITKERGRYERIIIRGAYAQSCLYKLARTNTYDLKQYETRRKTTTLQIVNIFGPRLLLCVMSETLIAVELTPLLPQLLLVSRLT